MKESAFNKQKSEKELTEEISQFDFCTSSLKKLAMKIRTDCAKMRLKNFYI